VNASWPKNGRASNGRLELSKAAKELEARRGERANADWERQWWWFNAAHREHVHEFSAAWEILRRTSAYRMIYNRMNALCLPRGTIDPRSLFDVFRVGSFMSQLPNMLPQSPPAPMELREMVARWQNMITDGWTPEKTYLEASQSSQAQCVLSDGKEIQIHIPPTFCVLNRGIPIILPRQVTSQGHTHLFGELCEVSFIAGHAPRIKHLAGSDSPTAMLGFMQSLNKPVTFEIDGRFIAIQFPLHHPVQALEALLPKRLDGIEASKVWTRQPDCPDRRSRRPHLVSGTLNPLEAIAFFAADEPRNLTEKAFRTLIRPEKLKQIMPRIRKEWIKWDSAELRRFDLKLPAEDALKQARIRWKNAERCARLAPQSIARPIKPDHDLDNLACGDCFPFYSRNRSALPVALPARLRNNADLNKRIETGRELVLSQDEVFLPLFGGSAEALSLNLKTVQKVPSVK